MNFVSQFYEKETFDSKSDLHTLSLQISARPSSFKASGLSVIILLFFLTQNPGNVSYGDATMYDFTPHT